MLFSLDFFIRLYFSYFILSMILWFYWNWWPSKNDVYNINTNILPKTFSWTQEPLELRWELQPDKVDFFSQNLCKILLFFTFFFLIFLFWFWIFVKRSFSDTFVVEYSCMNLWRFGKSTKLNQILEYQRKFCEKRIFKGGITWRDNVFRYLIIVSWW